MVTGTHSRLLRSVFWLAMVGVGGSRRAHAQPLPQSGEFQVNSYTLLNQVATGVAVNGQGDFVVVWQQHDATMPDEIVARRFTSAGVALASDFRVNTFTAGVQRQPVVGRSSAGGFVVVWTSALQDGAADGVFGRRFDASGTALGVEFQVNTVTASGQFRPTLAMRGAGDFVVVWQDLGQDGDGLGVFGRRFDSSGAAQASEFQVNTYVTLDQSQPSAFMTSDGNFVVSWTSDGQDGDGFGVFAQRFASDGTQIGVEFQMNAYTTGAQQFPAVTQIDDEVIVVWQSQDQDGSGLGIFGGGRDLDGTDPPEDTQVNEHTFDDQSGPAIHVTGGGEQTGLVVLWTSDLQDGGSYGVFGRSIDQRGSFDELDFGVNTTTPFQQFIPRVAGAGSRFVVVWTSALQDGSGTAVIGRRFVLPLTLDVDGNGMVDPLTDGLLVLRYEFGFNGGALITGAVAADCTRCTAPSIEAYLGSV